jgi:hypothetical protein
MTSEDLSHEQVPVCYATGMPSGIFVLAMLERARPIGCRTEQLIVWMARESISHRTELDCFPPSDSWVRALCLCLCLWTQDRLVFSRRKDSTDLNVTSEWWSSRRSQSVARFVRPRTSRDPASSTNFCDTERHRRRCVSSCVVFN